MRYQFIFLILISFLLNSAPAYAFSNDKQGEIFIDALGSLTNAIQSLSFEIDHQPFNYVHYYDLGNLYADIGNEELAQYNFSLAAYYVPDDSENFFDVFYMLARLSIDTENWENAREAINQVLTVNPNETSFLSLLFEVAHHDRDIELMAQTIHRIDEHNTTTVEPYNYFYREFVLNGTGDKDDMIRAFKRAIEIDPDSAEALRAYAITKRGTYENKGYLERLDEAAAHLKQAITMDPSYIDGHASLMYSYFWAMFVSKDRAEYGQQAIEWGHKTMTLDPENKKVDFLVGITHYYLNQYEQAIAYLVVSAEDESSKEESQAYLAMAYNQLAYGCYQSKACLEEGFVWIDKALALDPNDGVYISTKGELYFAMGNYEQAYEHIKRAMDISPQHEEIQRDWAMVQNKMVELKKNK